MSSRDYNALSAATAHAKNGDFERAIEALKGLIAQDPRNEIAVGMLAAIYAQLGMTERAIAYFEQVLALNPANALARVQLGQLHLSAGRPTEALAAWKPGLDDPGDFVTRFHTGLALLQLRRYAEARSMFEGAAAHMPKEHALYPQLQDLLRSGLH